MGQAGAGAYAFNEGALSCAILPVLEAVPAADGSGPWLLVWEGTRTSRSIFRFFQMPASFIMQTAEPIYPTKTTKIFNRFI